MGSSLFQRLDLASPVHSILDGDCLDHFRIVCTLQNVTVQGDSEKEEGGVDRLVSKLKEGVDEEK